MKALTIKQSWADHIAYGLKSTENRTWKTSYRGPVLIHAGAALDPHSRPWGEPLVREITRSAILGIARIADCHWSTGCCEPWGEPGVYHWTLTDVEALPMPVPCKGRLGLWTPSEEIVNVAIRQAEVAW